MSHHNVVRTSIAGVPMRPTVGRSCRCDGVAARHGIDTAAVSPNVAAMDIKTALLIPATASIALASAAVAFADPHDDDGGRQPTNISAPDAHGTVTVTATVAPGQCQPVAGGPTATEASDTGGQPVNDTPGVPPQTTAASSSRFDPYTCAPVPVSAGATTSTTATEHAGSTYTPSLMPFPYGGGSGNGPARGPLSEPTTSVLIPTPTTTEAPR